MEMLPAPLSDPTVRVTAEAGVMDRLPVIVIAPVVVKDEVEL